MAASLLRRGLVVGLRGRGSAVPFLLRRRSAFPWTMVSHPRRRLSTLENVRHHSERELSAASAAAAEGGLRTQAPGQTTKSWDHATRMKPSAETLQLTDRVKQKLRNLSSKHGGTAILRVDVDSGGCAGFSYKFLVESKPLSEDDILIEDGDARVVVHNMALGLINGSTLDWEEKLIGSKFYILNNPHSAGECGCKYSFTPKD